MDYLVAAIGDWNKEKFDKVKDSLPGNWLYASSPKELNAILETGFSPRYIFFPHWRWIVPTEMLDEYECVCFHMTDVPYGRGGSPLQNLIVRGHKDTVLTALRMVDELDAGPVYLKKPLSLQGSAEEIYNRSSSLIWSMIEDIITNNVVPSAQEGEVTLFKRRTPEQSYLPNDLNLEQVYDFIRMLAAPGYPKAFIETERYRLEFDQAQSENENLFARVKITLKEK